VHSHGLAEKKHMLADLLPMLPPHRFYVEVFSGSAKLLLNKQPSEWELLNDVNEEVINFFRVVKHRPSELADRFEADIVHAKRFKELRLVNPSPAIDEIERASRFGYLAWQSFGGKGEHFAGGFLYQGMRRPLDTVRELVDDVSERLRRVLMESRDCVECVRRYDSKETLFFLDPPYIGSSEKVGAYEEMPAEHHRELASVLAKAKGKFILTYNDHADVRKLYEGRRGITVTPINRKYTLGGGKPTDGLQLVIKNF
jgi:DNA adenine methylase